MGEKIQMKNFCGGVVVPEQHGVKNFFFFPSKKITLFAGWSIWCVSANNYNPFPYLEPTEPTFLFSIWQSPLDSLPPPLISKVQTSAWPPFSL